jgi:hypothetical protein
MSSQKEKCSPKSAMFFQIKNFELQTLSDQGGHIMNAYYTGTGYRVGTIETKSQKDRVFGDKLISVICAIVAMVTCPAAVIIEKASVVTALIFAFFGVIGSMETNKISLAFGTLICIAITLVEFLLLKSMTKKSSKKA